MRRTLAAVLALAAASTTASEGEHVSVITNPHQERSADEQACAVACSMMAVAPSDIIWNPFQTQADTFQGATTKKYLGLQVPVYQFKQPGRISSLELPFKLLLVHKLNLAKTIDVPVEESLAMDSWFPGYFWSVVLCEGCGAQGHTHLGWHFHSTDESQADFYAVIVDYHGENQRLRSATGERALIADGVQLDVGMPAASWMTSLLRMAKLDF
eukprot:COSAG05_NODE_4275_length_1587_cov_1.566532_2_plen_213_part_00